VTVAAKAIISRVNFQYQRSLIQISPGPPQYRVTLQAECHNICKVVPSHPEGHEQSGCSQQLDYATLIRGRQELAADSSTDMPPAFGQLPEY
jgi:hypothetical protein